MILNTTDCYSIGCYRLHVIALAPMAKRSAMTEGTFCSQSGSRLPPTNPGGLIISVVSESLSAASEAAVRRCTKGIWRYGCLEIRVSLEIRMSRGIQNVVLCVCNMDSATGSWFVLLLCSQLRRGSLFACDVSPVQMIVHVHHTSWSLHNWAPKAQKKKLPLVPMQL